MLLFSAEKRLKPVRCSVASGKIELEPFGDKGKRSRGYRFKGALSVGSLIDGKVFANADIPDTLTTVVDPGVI